MVVMKFGGTSVEDAAAIRRAAEIVRSRLADRPVVVVSAMAKVTDQLLAAGRAAANGDRDQALAISQGLRDRHFRTAAELLGSVQQLEGQGAQGAPSAESAPSKPGLGLGRGVPPSLEKLHSEFDALFNRLDELLRGVVAVAELSPRTTDFVSGFGEVLNSIQVAAAFRAAGLDAEHVDSREVIVTDANHTRAVPDFDETDARLQRRLRPLLDAKRVPVMGGFIGATREGVPTTIGRGGSDFSAAIVGAALDAERIEIWTDVDGMMTTDPNLCPGARRIKVISFNEAAELAYFGAKVLHPATIVPAIRKNIPVYILNSRNPSCEGTCITSAAPRSKTLLKAIAAKKRITIIDLVATRMLMAHGFLRDIFEVFDRHRCPVDVVSTSEVSVSVTVDTTDEVESLAADLAQLADVHHEGRKAIVCLVGENIRMTPGVAGKVFSAIGDHNVRMISQGASEINITFVIEEDEVPDVVRRLHDTFFTDVDPNVFA
jgi:aspartate kinase